ncbi:Ribosome-recycling factor [Trichinella pseudospiralis]
MTVLRVALLQLFMMKNLKRDMNTNRKCCQSDNAVCNSDDVVFDMSTTTLPNEAVLFALTRSKVLFTESVE